MTSHNLKIASHALWLGLFTSQFYIVSSGLPQVSHIVLLIFALFTFLIKDDYLSINKYTKWLFAFGLYSLVINILFSIICEEVEFYMFNIYFFYNVFILISIVKICRLDKTHILLNSLILSMILLCVFHIMGLGRFNYGNRYNGFFNDPNQMAFWSLCCSSIICLLTRKKTIKLYTLFLCTYICIISMSRSALVGLSILYVALFLSLNDYKSKYLPKSVQYIFIVVGLLVVAPIMVSSLSSIEDVSLVFERFATTDFKDQADIRGYSRFFDYPQYLLFGAGQGLDGRFNTDNEIHSTWAAFSFYYGIIGVTLFLTFLIRIFTKLRFNEKLLFIVPLLYSFSTFGARTPIFYIYLGVFLYYINSNDRNKNLT